MVQINKPVLKKKASILYEAYYSKMALITHNDTCLNTLSDIFEYL